MRWTASREGCRKWGPEQLAWLKKDLARFPKTAPIVVFTHRPLFAFPDPERVADKKPIAFDKEQPFRNQGVRVVSESAGNSGGGAGRGIDSAGVFRDHGVQQMLKEPGL